MLGLMESYSAPNVARSSLALPVLPYGAKLESVVPRLAKVWVGDEPLAILMDAHCNVLVGVVANRWSPAVDKILDRLIGSKDADLIYCRSNTLEGVLGAGFVYLTVKALAGLSRDAASLMVLKPMIKGALYVAPVSGVVLSIEGGAF